jgi:hypothetical protein
MQLTLSLLALAASAVVAQNAAGNPGGCQTSFSGTFSFQTSNVSSSKMMARGIDDVLDRPVRRQAASCGSSVTLTLKDGLLLDSKGRTGYIASNYQFQFDGPPQAGHLATSGFSVCGNGSLAIGPSAVFYNCLSGTFYNIYTQSQGPQCAEVLLETFPCQATGSVATAATSLISAPGEETNSQVATTSAAQSMMVMSAQTSAPASTFAASTASAAATPYPIASNGSTPAATGSAPPAGVTPAASTPAGGAPAASPSAFKGTGSVLAMGQGFVAMVAAAGAFFML